MSNWLTPDGSIAHSDDLSTVSSLKLQECSIHEKNSVLSVKPETAEVRVGPAEASELRE